MVDHRCVAKLRVPYGWYSIQGVSLLTGCPQKASAVCCSTEELDSTNSSCLTPFISLLDERRSQEALAVFEGGGIITSDWGPCGSLPADRIQTACGRKTDKAEEWKELWEPKFIAQICKIQCFILYTFYIIFFILYTFYMYVLYYIRFTEALNSS